MLQPSLRLMSLGVMSVCPFTIAILFGASLDAREFQVVPGSTSPDGTIALAIRPNIDGHDIVFFDVARKTPLGDNLSKETMFNLIGMAQREDTDKPNYKVVWSPDTKRVAFWVGSHQLSHVEAYELREGRSTKLELPDLEPQWIEIQRRVRPFRITKRWRREPSWLDAAHLRFQLAGSAFRNGSKRESDFLDYSFWVTVEFRNKKPARVVALAAVE